MSDKYKLILQQANAKIAAGDYEGFLLNCTDDTLWNFVGERMLEGKQEVREWIEATYIEPPRVTIDYLIEEGDFLTAVGTVSMKENNEWIKYFYCDIWKFRADKFAELRAFVIKSTRN